MNRGCGRHRLPDGNRHGRASQGGFAKHGSVVLVSPEDRHPVARDPGWTVLHGGERDRGASIKGKTHHATLRERRRKSRPIDRRRIERDRARAALTGRERRRYTPNDRHTNDGAALPGGPEGVGIVDRHGEG